MFLCSAGGDLYEPHRVSIRSAAMAAVGEGGAAAGSAAGENNGTAAFGASRRHLQGHSGVLGNTRLAVTGAAGEGQQPLLLAGGAAAASRQARQRGGGADDGGLGDADERQ